MKLWLLRWLWRSLIDSGLLVGLTPITRAATIELRVESLESHRGVIEANVKEAIDDFARALSNMGARVVALEVSGQKVSTPDLAPALRQLVAYIVVSAYRGSDQEGVMTAIEEVWGPIKEHLVANGVLAKGEA